MLPGWVVPGQLIVDSGEKYEAGPGVEPFGRGLRASLLGKVVVTDATDTGSTADGSKKPKLSVINQFQNPYSSMAEDKTSVNSRRSVSQVPQLGDLVYAQVLRLGREQINLEIVAVEGRGNSLSDDASGVQASAIGSVNVTNAKPSDMNDVGEGYGAVIRIQDIRATERDKVKIHNNFRPGDIVRAVVLSLGDSQNFYLTTAREDLGVVFARDPHSGHQLLPADWQNLVDPIDGSSVPRKVANPFVT